MNRDDCRTYSVDGQPVVVRGSQPLTDDEQALLAEVVAAAKKHLAENPPQVRSVPRLRVGGTHGSRIMQAAKCPVHGWVGPDRRVRRTAWEDARAHDREHHPQPSASETGEH